MKISTMIPTLAIVATAAASLSLPATASADPFRHEVAPVMHGAYPGDAYARPVHDERRYSPIQYEPRYQYDRGHHYGHRRPDVYRYDYRPVERRDYRYDYRPVERPRIDYRPVEVYTPRLNDDIRVRISYDLHL